MGFRRTLLRGVAALAAGGSLTGVFGTAGSTPVARALHDTERSLGAETTVTARIDPAARDAVGLPAAVEPRWRGIRSTYPSVDPSAFEVVSASVGVDGDTVVGGCAIAEGRFDEPELVDDLAERGATSLGTAGDGSERFSIPDSPYVVGLVDGAIVVGHGQSDEAALANVTSGLRNGVDGTDGRSESASGSLTGDAVSYATIGPGTRSQLLERAASSPAGVKRLLRNAEAFGVAIEAADRRSRIQYGAVVDPAALSASELWELAGSVGDDHDLTPESISRHGRMIVLEATARTGSLWATHDRVLGSLSG